MSKGKLIEQLTSIIEETLQGNERVKVIHDVTLKDESGNDRQIDVLIEYFENDRFTFRTIIECKEKSRDGVEINQMHAFAGTFQSLPQVHQAIFVSTKGFQKGAIRIAEKNNILLYTLEELKGKELQKLFIKAPAVSETSKHFELLNWKLLLKEEDEKLLKGANLEVKADELLLKENGETIIIKNIILALLPYVANQLHNKLLNAYISGLDIYKEKYISFPIFPFQEGIFLIQENKKIPINYLELKIMVWFESKEVEQGKYLLYKDNKGDIIADAIHAKIDFSGSDIYLSIVENKGNSQKALYLLDGVSGKKKLEIDQTIEIPNKNHTTIIMKNPYENK